MGYPTVKVTGGKGAELTLSLAESLFDAPYGLFKMWYMSGYVGCASYAESVDGVHWTRPELDVVAGTNHILPHTINPDSGGVILDDDAPADERFKMMHREPDRPGRPVHTPTRMYVSGDGKHWREIGTTGPMGDRSTLFYNPFRRRWVQSLRGCPPSATPRRARKIGDDGHGTVFLHHHVLPLFIGEAHGARAGIDAFLRTAPIDRTGTAADHQGAVVYLASEASDFMVGQELIIDGGYTIM